MAGIWSGFLTFGLVTMPVRLYTGARGERVGFRMLHDADHARLKQQMVCTRDGEVVERDHTVRGYEYAKGEYVVLSDEQIQAAAPRTERQLEIVEFCHAGEIDPVWFETSYYLLPDAAGKRAYALLLQALRESDRVAVAQLSMHNREYLSLVRPSRLAGVPGGHVAEGGKTNSGRQGRDGLLLHTLFYLDEVRVADGYGSPGAEPAEAELQLARQLIEGLTRPFDPSRFHDRYRQNLEAAIAAALEGKPAPKAPAARRLAPVTDLMQTLKASLGQMEPQPARRSASQAPAKPRRRRAA